MSIIAWIALRPGRGPDRQYADSRPQTAVPHPHLRHRHRRRTARRLGAVTKLFHIHSKQGFFNLSTWLTAIAGAAILLLGHHLISGQSSSRRGWFAHR
jgi:hypothetical protein